MSIVESIIKKILLVCLIPFFIILKLIALFLFFLLSITIYPVKHFMINIRDTILGKNMFLFKDTHDKYYKVPLITYFSSFTIIGLLVGLTTAIHADYISKTHQIDLFVIIISYLSSSFVYLLAFYFGMYRRFKVDKNNIKNKSIFLENLSIHRQFLNLSFIPLTFVITVIGIISSLKIPIKISIYDFNSSLNYISNIMINYIDSNNFLILLLGFILNLTILFILLYIFTIPLQLIALFINYVFKYFYEHGRYYKDIFQDFDIDR
ncbi:hypothetical protein ACWEW8_06970 [Staphylococcus xylosus]|uniref:hypothetical protein n=1 Tax=Staphylococcus xylosus TaxID=1288 RepID=UPI003F561BB7